MNTWLLALRPKTLWASAAPVLIGTAMAFGDGLFHGPSAFAALFCALLIQAGTNLANDYFDSKNGVDTKLRRGPVRVTQAGLIPAEAVCVAFIVCFLLAVLVSIWLAVRAGMPVVIIGGLSVLSGIFYTAGPRPLSHLGLGEVFVLIFFGPVAVAGTYFVQSLEWNSTALAAGLAPGLMSAAVLAVNNLRDIATDRLAGKKTLAVRFGLVFARWEYLILVILACLVPTGLFIITKASGTILLSSLAFVCFLPAARTVFVSDSGQELNAALARTGQALFIYAIMFSILYIIGVC